MLMLLYLLALCVLCMVPSYVCKGPTVNMDPNTGIGTLLLDSFTYEKVVPTSSDMLLMISDKFHMGNPLKDDLRKDFLSLRSNSTLFAQLVVNGAENKILSSKIEEASGNVGAEMPAFYFFRKSVWRPIALKIDNVYHLSEKMKQDHGIDDVMLDEDVGFEGEYKQELNGHVRNFFVKKNSRSETISAMQGILDSIDDQEETKDIRDQINVHLRILSSLVNKNINEEVNWLEDEVRRLDTIVKGTRVNEARKKEFRKRIGVLLRIKSIATLVKETV
jgi:hypothetical protein